MKKKTLWGPPCLSLKENQQAKLLLASVEGLKGEADGSQRKCSKKKYICKAKRMLLSNTHKRRWRKWKEASRRQAHAAVLRWGKKGRKESARIRRSMINNRWAKGVSSGQNQAAVEERENWVCCLLNVRHRSKHLPRGSKKMMAMYRRQENKK